MWTNENRGFYDRSKLRYPSDLTDEEWALIEPAKRAGGKRTVDMREVVNALMYVLSTGCQWRAIPKDLPPRSTAHGYLKAIRCRKGIRGSAQTLDRRADHRLTEPVQEAGQGLGVLELQRLGVPAMDVHPPHAPKALQENKMIPDRL